MQQAQKMRHIKDSHEIHLLSHSQQTRVRDSIRFSTTAFNHPSQENLQSTPHVVSIVCLWPTSKRLEDYTGFQPRSMPALHKAGGPWQKVADFVIKICIIMVDMKLEKPIGNLNSSVLLFPNYRVAAFQP